MPAAPDALLLNVKVRQRIEELAGEKCERGLLNRISKIAFDDIRKIGRPERPAASSLGLRPVF
jgi:hypothetical protein